MSAAIKGQWPVYSDEEVGAVAQVLHKGAGNYWTGNLGRRFEQQYAAHCGVRHGIALANGSLALELALEAAGIGPGDDVIVTPRSFIASASCVIRVGARPVFADVCPDSQNITPETVSEALTEATRAIVAVHHAGWPCDMDGFMKLADQNDLIVIEDCAQAHGAKYKSKPVGGLGHIGVFSFCQDKVISTGGEGGMLVTDDADIWNRAWSIKDHGKRHERSTTTPSQPGFRWLHDSFGTNMRMTEMQAAIGLLQLEKLSEWNKKRASNAHRIAQTLSDFQSVRMPMPPPEIVHAFYRLYAFVEDQHLADGWNRDRILAELEQRGVPGLSGTCPEIYREKAFTGTDMQPLGRLRAAAELGATSLAFLVHPSLTDEDLSFICDTLDEVFGEATV